MRAAMTLAAAALLAVPLAATAKPATCFNSDDGRYPCDFRQFGGDGSFTVSARGVPTYTIAITGREVADGFADYGNGSGNIFLPGPFYRSQADRACWISEATRFRICAY